MKLQLLIALIFITTNIAAQPNNQQIEVVAEEENTTSKSFLADIKKFERKGMVYHYDSQKEHLQPYTGWSAITTGEIANIPVEDLSEVNNHPYKYGVQPGGPSIGDNKIVFPFYRIERGSVYNGPYKEYIVNEAGKKELSFKGFIKDGLLSGEATFFYTSTNSHKNSPIEVGDTLSKGFFDDGEMVGEWWYYGSFGYWGTVDDNIGLTLKREYEKGKYFPVKVSHYELLKGKLFMFAEAELISANLLKSVRQFFYDGQIKRTEELMNHQDSGQDFIATYKIRDYYFNGLCEGCLRAKGYVTRKRELYKQIGYWEVFHDNGNLYRKGDYVNGKESGEWKYYHENGTLQSILIYRGDDKSYVDMWDEKGNQLVKNGNGEIRTVMGKVVKIEKVENGRMTVSYEK